LEVKEKEEPSEVHDAPKKYTLGVTDLIFNPVFAIYERGLKTKQGIFVSPAFWLQESTEYVQNYWLEDNNRNFPVSAVE
jgi:hypothetical protein